MLSTTPVGTLDGAARGEVDPRGLLLLPGVGWELDWWIGAEDRWHVPAESPTVRQALLGSSPVTETRVRVPSGDAVQRICAARARSGPDVAIVEVVNETKVPFAVAFVLRPIDGASARTIEVDDTSIAVDGVPVVSLPRVPGRVAIERGGGALQSTVFGGNAGMPGMTGLTGEGNQVAVLYPLAHTASVRVAVPISHLGAAVDLDGLPTAKQVVAGWQAQARQGARITLPERRVQEAVDARVRRALLEPGGVSGAASLDLFGFADAAGAVLRELLEDPWSMVEPGRALLALGRHVAFTDDGAFAAEASPAVAELIGRLRSNQPPPELHRAARAMPLVARLLSRAGHTRGAADAERVGATLLERLGPEPPAATDERVRSTVREATGTWRWPERDHEVAGELVDDVRSILVDDRAGHLDLNPLVPTTWLGQGWEAHDLPTAHGPVSFAVRWHADRPALLWEHQPLGGRSVALRVPGLDPRWSSTEPRGEALLAPVALPPPPERVGLSIPVSIEPVPRR
jgi:hypothetical protein